MTDSHDDFAQMNPILFPLLLSLISSVLALDRIGFLFRNQQLCGNLFAEAQWVPVLDMCELECKDTEICVENDELTQKCKPLPNECNEAWEMLKLQTTPHRARIRSGVAMTAAFKQML